MKNATELIKHFEGFHTHAYQFPGEPFYTIGYGRSRVPANEVTTREKEEKWLQDYIQGLRDQVKDLGIKLNYNQTEALISFAYNVGFYALKTSTLVKLLRVKDPQASEQFLRWNKGMGRKVLPGLTRRRKAEKALFDLPISKKEVTLMKAIKLVQAAKYTKGNLPHQNKAWDWLQTRVSAGDLQTFANLYRSNPKEESRGSRVVLPNFKLSSQRDNKGDLNRDGRADWAQTCNVTSCAMVVNYLTTNNVTPTQLDRHVLNRYGSRYSHANLVKTMSDYGVKSSFSVSTSHSAIKACLDKGNPVIWSNKLTHGGHIVVIAGYTDATGKYLIFDPYGEPFPVRADKTRWQYKDIRKPYWLSYSSFDVVNANGYNYYKKEHWAHLCEIG